jgi:hypothetical protein
MLLPLLLSWLSSRATVEAAGAAGLAARLLFCSKLLPLLLLLLAKLL